MFTSLCYNEFWNWGGYSEEEKRVLVATSNINSIEYVPFISADLRYGFIICMPGKINNDKYLYPPISFGFRFSVKVKFCWKKTLSEIQKNILEYHNEQPSPK